MNTNISRRRFLQSVGVVLAQMGLTGLAGCVPTVERPADTPMPTVSPQATDTLASSALAQATNTTSPTASPPPTDTLASPTLAQAADTLETQAHLPLVARSPEPTPLPTLPPPTGSRVVHVHKQNATSWSGQTPYWNYVDQGVVNQMMDQGMMALTGAATVEGAWRALLPNYRPGEIIAIKANFNNSGGAGDTDGQIDGLIQPVNAIIRGLKTMGVPEPSICVYDASRCLPDRFVNGCLYSGVVFADSACRQKVTWQSGDSNAYVTFRPPAGHPGLPQTRIDDMLINCTYLINMPILKAHRIAGVSLTFKNLFGDISAPWDLHNYIRLSDPLYRSDYNPLVDIYRNPHIQGKTILAVGDGLLAAKDFEAAPSAWSTFGNRVPNSLFLSTDPVATDCVLCDFLNAEIGLPSATDDYLRLAQQAGLGTYERGNPWGNGYNAIDYIRLT